MDEENFHKGYDQPDKLQYHKIDEKVFDGFNKGVPQNGHCHENTTEIGHDKVARRKLIIASILCLVFMVGEAVGGYLAYSLAIMTDAAHLLTDFASFVISLLALYFASRPATKSMSFGWHRAEVMGALISVLMIWLITGILLYMAIMRIVSGKYEINGKIMLITSAIGVLVNIIMATALHQHGPASGHGHSHNTGVLEKMRKSLKKIKTSMDDVPSLTESRAFKNGQKRQYTNNANIEEKSPEHHPVELCEAKESDCDHSHNEPKKQNINVRAAFIHVIGDLLQSVGVMVAAIIIYINPSYKIADPICTFIFSVLVLITTITILRDAMNILMEGTPRGIDFNEVKASLCAIPGIVDVHNLRMWSLTTDKNAVSVHLTINGNTEEQAILCRANRLLRRRFLVYEVTIQTEKFTEDMANCKECQKLRN